MMWSFWKKSQVSTAAVMASAVTLSEGALPETAANELADAPLTGPAFATGRAVWNDGKNLGWGAL